jgi:hypothetical protein
MSALAAAKSDRNQQEVKKNAEMELVLGTPVENPTACSAKPDENQRHPTG